MSMPSEHNTAAVAAGDVASRQGQYLTFFLAGEEYGVDILRVQEIKGWDTVTRVPRTADYVLGVINLRGAVVPIVSLRRRLGMADAPFGPTTVVIVIKVHGVRGERTVGLVVDAVSEVYNLTAEAMRPAPEIDGRVAAQYVDSIAMVQEKMLILLDLDTLIAAGLEGEGALN